MEKIFAIDDSIRYVAVADSKFQLIQSKMRENTPSLTSEETDSAFFSWVPSVMIEGVSKISSYVGSVVSVTIQYEKLLAIYVPVKSYVVALTLNPTTKQSTREIAGSVKALIEAATA